MSSLVMLWLAVSPSDAGAGQTQNPDAGPAGRTRLDPAAMVQGGYGLRLSGRGYAYEDQNFEARVAPDGTVSFRDKHGRASFTPIAWVAKVEQPPPSGNAGNAYSQRAPWLPGPETTQGPTRSMAPEEVCPPGSPCWMPPGMNVTLASTSLDLTDEIMRTLGKDPYAREKARFLSATFEFRMKLAVASRQDRMDDALDFMPQRLEALWADTRYSPRERRRILYQLWYETDATPEGVRAAGMIDLFVKNRLPCGSADGYTRAELDEFRRIHPDRPFTAADGCGPAGRTR